MQDEKFIIKKLENLKCVKPSQEWVSSVKGNILKEEKKIFSFNWLFMPVGRPALAFAMRSLMITVVAASGIFFYIYYLNAGSGKILEIPLVFQNEENKEINNSLSQIQDTLQEINYSLAGLKNAKDLKQALAISEVIKGTAERGEETVKEIKDNNPSSKKILASLTEVEDAFKSLQKESSLVQSEMIGVALEDLKTRTLSSQNSERLLKADEYFLNGQHNDAMILIIKIMENQ